MKALGELGERHKAFRKNVQLGLKCKLFVRKRNWREAESIWNKLEDRDDEMNQGMLRQILLLKSQDLGISVDERSRAADDAALLDPDLRRGIAVFNHDVDEPN